MPLTDKQQEEWKRWHGQDEFKIGRQYYKSGWMNKAPENFLGTSKKRWFQLRHWVLYYFEEEQDSYNYPEWGPDHKVEEDQSSVFDFPGLDISFPSFSLPDLSMPDLSMPDISMPDISMPSMSMPSMSMPSMGEMKMPSMPKRKERIKGGPLGMIMIYNGATVKRSGKKITIEKAHQYRIFKGENEEKKNRKFELTAEDDEEGESWYESLVYGGATPAE